MEEQLITKICSRCKLSDKDEKLLRQTLRTLHYPKGSVVIAEGMIDDSIYFLQKGVWRVHMPVEGKDHTIWIASPGETVFSSWGFLRGLPSRITISSACDSIAIEMKKETVDKLCLSSSSFSEYLIDLYIDILLATDEQLMEIASSKVKKRKNT